MKIKSLCFVIAIVVLGIFYGCSTNDTIPDYANIPQNPVETTKPVSIPVENTLGVLIHAPKAYNGYTLFTIYKDTYLINNCGQLINNWKSDYIPGNAVYLLDDGSILRAGKIDNSEMPYGGLGGIIEIIDWDGKILWSYTYSNSTQAQHHDIYPLPNGNILILGATKKTLEETIKAGRDPNKIDDGILYNEQVIEVKPTGLTSGDIVWEWNIWDHLIQDLDSTKNNYGHIQNNPQLLNINYLGKGNINTDADWLHINSINYNRGLDQILLSIHGLDELFIIDHSTTTQEAASHSGGRYGMGGDILYRWGNPHAYEQGAASEQLLYGQHHVQWIPSQYPDAGKIIFFNNGSGRQGNYSSVEIIDPPTDGMGNYIKDGDTSFGPATITWQYVNPIDPSKFYSKILSSAQRLPNGNTLICEGLKGNIFEIDTKNNIVWKYINPETTLGNIMKQGEIPESNSLFRATKYSVDHSAFKGKDLTPKNPIEVNFNLGNCNGTLQITTNP